MLGDMAYTAGLEHTSCSVDGQAGSYTLRATQVYRFEDGEWKVAHRHGDIVASDGAAQASGELALSSLGSA